MFLDTKSSPNLFDYRPSKYFLNPLSNPQKLFLPVSPKEKQEVLLYLRIYFQIYQLLICNIFVSIILTTGLSWFNNNNILNLNHHEISLLISICLVKSKLT